MDEHRLCKVTLQADAQLSFRYGWLSGLKAELLKHDIRISRTLAEFDLAGTSRALKESYILQDMTTFKALTIA